MTRCDICGADATMLVGSRDNGNQYGSFQSFRCDPHGREAIDAHKAAGFTVQVQRIERDEQNVMGDETVAPEKAA